MFDELIIFIVSGISAILFFWSFRNLPDEKWQFIASCPAEKVEDGIWKGFNFTFYGFFSATGYALGSLFYIFMMLSIKVSLSWLIMPALILLCICMPAASLVAKLVERKKYTLTIGGASFIGIICAPWIISGINLVSEYYQYDYHIPVWPALAALATAYCIGESIGRLGCISFGCCYGRPVSEISGRISKILNKISFIFYGKTKKISYESSLDGEKVIPVQALSAIILLAAFISGLYLFLKGYHSASLIASLSISQIWRAYSETLRADYRGIAKITAYQKMAIISVFYIITLNFSGLWSNSSITTTSEVGLKMIWNPWIILFFQAVWFISFYYSGKSKVTSVMLKYSVIEKNI
jgi:hypothetical protein